MKKDWILTLGIVLVTVFGLTTLYSTVVGEESLLGGGVFNRQLLFVLFSYIVYFTLTYIDYRFLGNALFLGPVILIVILMLVAVLVIGPEINNSQRWLIIGGFQLQPSEFAKIALLVGSAWILSMRDRYSIAVLSGICSVIALIFAGLIFIEPDAGTTVVMLGIWGVFMFAVLPHKLRNAALLGVIISSIVSVIAFISQNYTVGAISGAISVGITSALFLLSKNVKILPFIAVFVGVALGFAAMFMWNNVFHDYQRDRVETFINPGEKSQGSGFQVEQSKVAIGSGMIWGKGFGLGTQSKLRFLPEHQTDFIFATYAEEFGLIGSLSLLTLYGVILFRIFRASIIVENRFGSYLCLAIGIKLLLEVFINMSMNMGMIPATGVPLPLMSAGGSMFLVTMTGLGLVQSTLVHREISL